MRAQLCPFARAAMLAAALLLPLPAATAEQPIKVENAASDFDLQKRRVAAVLELTNLRDGIASWRKMLLAPASFPNCQCGTADRIQERMDKAWVKAVTRAYDGEQVYSRIAQAMAGAFSPVEIEEIRGFLASPFGRKITMLEKQAIDRQQDESGLPARLLAAEMALRKDAARKKIFEEIMAATGGTRPLVDAMLGISLGNALGVAAAAPAGRPRMSSDEIARLVESARSGMQRALYMPVLLTHVDMLNPLSTEELKRLHAFATSPVGRKYVHVPSQAFSDAVHGQAIRIGEAFAKDFNAQEI